MASSRVRAPDRQGDQHDQKASRRARPLASWLELVVVWVRRPKAVATNPKVTGPEGRAEEGQDPPGRLGPAPDARRHDVHPHGVEARPGATEHGGRRKTAGRQPTTMAGLRRARAKIPVAISWQTDATTSRRLPPRSRASAGRPGGLPTTIPPITPIASRGARASTRAADMA